tara:strand:- start:1353 stop:2309 length:957 start_codon:yes stop_codon:yes gene_type:complete
MRKIIIISGDPNSINSELIYKSISKIKGNIRKKIYLISNYNLIQSQFKKLRIKLKLSLVNNLNEKENSKDIKIIDVKLKFKDPFNVNKINASNYILKSLDLAHRFATIRNDVGLINCPINKELLNKQKIGVTEYLSFKSKINKDDKAMLITNKKLAVCPVTTHIDIRDIKKTLNKIKIIRKSITIEKWFRKKFKRKPKIGILGLNPHNAEMRKNSEEKKIIIPAISKLRKLGFLVKGPLVADTVFIKDFKNYDILIGMYHDQVLTPFKTIFKFDAINITLGLKYLRVSPDHGVAKNLILKNKANPLSLIKCIEFVNKA